MPLSGHLRSANGTMNILEQQDPDVFSAISAEEHSQADWREMLASEN
jgi:hypothetical protein